MGISDRVKKFENTPDIVEETPFIEFVTEALFRKISSIPVWYDYDYSKQFELILNFLDNKLNSEFEDLQLSESEKREIAEEFLKNSKGFGILDKLLAEQDVSAVLVNSLGSVYAQKGENYVKTDLILSAGQFDEIASRYKETSPIVKVCHNQLQITLIKPPVSDNMLIIRKINDILDNLTDIKDIGLLPIELEEYLRNILGLRKNIIITGSAQPIINEFIQILINSIDESLRVSVIEDSLPYNAGFDNISSFSVASLNQFEFEYLMSSIKELRTDYTVTSLCDYKKFASYYLNTDSLTKGLITLVPAKNISDVLAKLIDITQRTLKCTEKQAKLKLSSVYDCIIQVENIFDKRYCISSIMEISSSKSSSLVTDEIVRCLDGDYVLDLPAQISDDAGVHEDVKPSKSFRSRLKK